MKFADLENSTQVILKVVFVVLALAFLWTIREVIVLFLLAVVLASAMEPLVDYLHIKKIPRALTVIGVYVVVFAVVGLVASLVVPLVIEQTKLLVQNLPQYFTEFQSHYPGLHSLIGGGDIGQLINNFFATSGGEQASVFSRTLGVFNGVLGFVTILVISLYLVAEQKGMKDFISTLVPLGKREFTIQLVTKIQKKMGLWVLGQLILSVSIFAFTFIGLSLLGVKYALVLALLAGVLEIIPYVGPILSAIPAIFFAFLQSPALALAVLVLYILVQKLEGYVLVPKIMQKTVGISPLVVVLALIIGLKLAGVLGLLLAVPLASAITVIVQEFSGDQAHSS